MRKDGNIIKLLFVIRALVYSLFLITTSLILFHSISPPFSLVAIHITYAVLIYLLLIFNEIRRDRQRRF